MNHFAHLLLAQPTVESAVGNLLGDFARGVDQASLSPAVLAGLNNHRAVDRFTDAHPLVQQMKRNFSTRRRRFAGIALDIYFDHLLLHHWRHFYRRDASSVIAEIYGRLSAGQPLMPNTSMRQTTQRMIEHDWFGSYRDLDAIAAALDRVAGRIRFAHRFDNSIEDIQRNRALIDEGFFEFYPQLRRHVAELALESAAEDR